MKEVVKKLLLFVCVLAFIGLLIFVGNVVFLAKHIESVSNVYFAYAFYGVLFVLLLFFVVLPIIRLCKMPELPKFHTTDSRTSNKEMLSVARNLVATFPEERKSEKKYFSSAVESNSIAKPQSQSKLVEEEIKKRLAVIDETIKKYAKRVFVLTAISQSNRFDAITVWILNFRMIHDLISSTGFRPNGYQMFQIYWRVIVTGGFAYAVSDLADWTGEKLLNEMSTEIGEKVGSSIFGNLLGLFTKSLADGAVNGLLTLRLGYITQKYLEIGFDKYKDGKEMLNVYKWAIKEAWKSRKMINEIKLAS
jgi:uncharacterized membrane protein YcjF (UPF0283 family)